MHKFQITKAEEIIKIEVFKGNDVILTKDFPLEGFNLDEARQQLKRDVQTLEVQQKEKERLENKKNELKKLLNKKFDL